MVVLDTKSSWKTWHPWDNPMKTPETGAGEDRVLEGQPSTKEGAVCVVYFSRS